MYLASIIIGTVKVVFSVVSKATHQVQAQSFYSISVTVVTQYHSNIVSLSTSTYMYQHVLESVICLYDNISLKSINLYLSAVSVVVNTVYLLLTCLLSNE